MSAKPEHLHGRELWKALIAGSVGNFLEWFDFALYGMFANEIAATFFPEGDAATQLLQSFAVFAGAFVMRPFGGVLFGYIGDKHGRVHSMQLAMSLMAIPTTAIAVLPGYDTLGITSTLLLTVIRLIQGLSVGGAFGGLMTYAMEVTPPQHFGLVSALLKGQETALTARTLLKVFSAAGTLVGSLVAALMHAIYTDSELRDYAWRLPFVLGIGVSVVGIWMRRGLREAAQFEEARQSGELVDDAAGLGRGLLRIAPQIVRVICVINLNNIGFYVLFTWLPAFLSNARYWCEASGCRWLDDDDDSGAAWPANGSAAAPSDDFLQEDLHCALEGEGEGEGGAAALSRCGWGGGRPLRGAYTLNSLFMVYSLSVEVFAGILSDRRGSPDWCMAIGILGVIFTTPLAFWVYKARQGDWSLVLGSLPVGFFYSFYVGPMTWWMSRQLPEVQTRNTAMGLTYNVAAMISGASPFVATAIAASSDVMWVGYTTSFLAALSLLGLLLSPTFQWQRPAAQRMERMEVARLLDE